MHVLAVDDNAANLLLVRATLKQAGHTVTTATNGAEAWDILKQQKFDAVVTDWMMPIVDGMDLIKLIRRDVRPHPVVIMVTASTDSAGRGSALDAGADDYLLKPLNVHELQSRLANLFARANQATPTLPPSAPAAPATPSAPAPPRPAAAAPPAAPPRPSAPAPAPPSAAPPAPAPARARAGTFMAVAIGASTGGPPAVEEVLRKLTANTNAAYYVIVHGPTWMQSSFAKTLQRCTTMPVSLARDGMASEPGHVYVNPGSIHMSVNPTTLAIRLLDTPEENFVKPALDPLYRGLAAAFGSRLIAAVLTGMGKDGFLGCVEVHQQGGKVLVQDPETAVVPAMPNAVISSGIPHSVLQLADIAAAIDRFVGAR